MNQSNLSEITQCPDCFNQLHWQINGEIICLKCDAKYMRSHSGIPILLSSLNEIFPPAAYLDAHTGVRKEKNKFLKGFFSSSINLIGNRFIGLIANSLPPGSLILVVGGGNQKKNIDEIFQHKKIAIIYIDVDVFSDVDIFCDAHNLPFIANTFDAVITTAVLEHVMCPEVVVKEITRVLKVGGLLYSEIPFMQQVHEGAYDFTRYSLSGHRRLWNFFLEINSGMVAGPGTSLYWSIEYFFTSFSETSAGFKCLKILARALFFWIKWFDYALQNKTRAMDGASCTYFFGKKNMQKVSDLLIIQRYNGGIKLKHF